MEAAVYNSPAILTTDLRRRLCIRTYGSRSHRGGPQRSFAVKKERNDWEY